MDPDAVHPPSELEGPHLSKTVKYVSLMYSTPLASNLVCPRKSWNSAENLVSYSRDNVCFL